MKNATTIADVAKALGCNAKAATSRLVALGYVQSCGRCGGSGRYSFNPVDGDRCFGCNGSGKSLPRLTAKIVADAKARQDAGELSDYFVRNAARAAATKAIEPALAELNSQCGNGGIRAQYNRHDREKISAHVFVNSNYFRASHLLCSINDAGFKAYLNWKYSGASSEKTLATLAEMTEYARTVNAAAAPMVDAWHAKMAKEEVAYQAKQAQEHAEYEAAQAKEAEERKAATARLEAERRARYAMTA